MQVYESVYRKIQNIRRTSRSDQRFSFLDSLRKGTFLGYIQYVTSRISHASKLITLSAIDAVLFLPLLLLPKQLAFKRYGVSDVDGTYARSYSSFLKRRDTSLASGSLLVLVLCFQILTTTSVTLSQPRVTQAITVCQEQNTCDYKTIQRAVNNADDGDVIIVSEGEYRENINLFGKKISLLSEEGSEKTSIIGDGNTSTITIPTRSDSPLLVRGFTITSENNSTPPMIGGGILVTGDHTVVTLEKCIIKENTASLGGGIYSEGVHLILQDSILETNSATTSSNQGSGGGLYFEDGLLILESSVFDRNQADVFGGGVSILNAHTSSSIFDTTFLYNKTTQTEIGGGGGVSAENTDITIYGNVFEGNSSAMDGGALLVQGEQSTVEIGDGTIPHANTFVDNVAQNNGGNIASLNLLASSISKNTFEARSHEKHAELGAGIYAINTYALYVSENSFDSLQAESGAGISLASTSATLTNNIFVSQNVNSQGASLHVTESANTSLSVYHNVISQNRVFQDGGASVFFADSISSLRFFNNIIEKTYAGTGLYSKHHLNAEEVHHNDVWNNEVSNFSDAKLLSSNISVDPLFADRTNKNFHLLGQSLLVNQGHDEVYLTSDIDGDMRPANGTLPDIGIDEVQTPYEERPFYIDTQDGNDLSGQGTSAKPFSTVSQAISLHNSLAGKTFYIQGQITEPIILTQEHSGINKKPFTISQWPEKDKLVVYSSEHDYGVQISGADFITLDGLEIIGSKEAAILLENSDNIVIQNSIITDNNTYGILVHSSNEVEILNNTLVNNSRHITFDASSISGHIANTIFSLSKDEVGISVSSDSTNLFKSDYNNFFLQSDSASVGSWTKATLQSLDEWKTFSKQDKDSMSSDPLFVSAVSGNWELTPNSPCIDTGAPEINPPAYDKNGAPRPYIAAPYFTGRADIGAFEFNFSQPSITKISNQVSDTNKLQIVIEISSSDNMEYALGNSQGESWIQKNGTLKNDPYWSDQVEWAFDNPTANTSYGFKVIARNKKQTSYTNWSNTASIITSSSEVQGLATTNVTKSQASLGWNISRTSVDSYELSYGTDPIAENGNQITDLDSVLYQLSNLSEGTTYYWKVRSSNENGLSIWSNPAVFTTLGEKIQSTSQTSQQTSNSNTSTQENDETGIFSLSSVRAESDISAATITWRTNQLATSKVEYGTTSSFGQTVEVTDSTTEEHSIELADLTDNILYYFRVSSTNPDGGTVISDLYTFTPSEIVKTPIIVSPEMSLETTNQTPVITGLAQSGVTIKVYIDGILDGETFATTTPTGTGSFAYTVSNELLPDEHYVQVLAENGAEVQSEITERREFTIFSKYVTETLNLIRHQYEENPLNSTSNTRPMFVGLGYQNSVVKIYIDGEIIEEFNLPENGSEVIDFSHRLISPLEIGNHEAYYEVYNKDNDLTLRTRPLIFRVVSELPVPIILMPSQNETTSPTPIIAGIASEHNTVSIFIDGVKYGETTASSGEKGIGSFEYTIPAILKAGEHAITTQAEDSYHKKSDHSDTLTIITP